MWGNFRRFKSITSLDPISEVENKPYKSIRWVTRSFSLSNRMNSTQAETASHTDLVIRLWKTPSPNPHSMEPTLEKEKTVIASSSSWTVCSVCVGEEIRGSAQKGCEEQKCGGHFVGREEERRERRGGKTQPVTTNGFQARTSCEESGTKEST